MAQSGKRADGAAPDNKTVQYQQSQQSKITIDDVAKALGVSKTTVSRAISGKGRIGESTRQRVMEYIKRNHYRPNVVAKGLANSKTYNIGWVIPGDSGVTDLPFFQRCMTGISEIAAEEDYDILITMVYDHNNSQLRRVVKNHKVDGIILGRTLIDDKAVSLLKEEGVPFVVIGSSPDEGVIQVDNDHVSACRELTSILIMKGVKNFALIGGDSNHVVNQTRKEGFELALREQNIMPDSKMIYMDCDTDEIVDHVVEECLQNDVECIMCMDDRICRSVMDKLLREGVRIPDEIKVASFYNSVILENYQPSITALQYDPKELGIVACRTLFDYIAGNEVQKKVLLGYDVILKGSTK